MLGQPGALQHYTHEDEQRHRHQHRVLHDAHDAIGHESEQIHAFGIDPEKQGNAAKGKGNREAQHQQEEGSSEHNHTDHARPSAPCLGS